MAEIVVLNGITYIIPDVGDEDWGQNVTDYLVAIPNAVLQKSGGLFPLSADVNFGPTFGLISPYYKSTSANIASAGVLRLANADNIEWRNFANSGNNILGVNASDQLTFNGSPIELAALPSGDIFVGNASNVATAVPMTGDIGITNAGVTSIQPGVIVNADVNATAAIAYSKLNLTGSIVNNDIGSSAAIVYSKLALTNSIVNSDINSAAAIAYSKLNLAGSVKLTSDVTGILPVVNGGTGVASLGNLTDAGTDGITITGGTAAVITSISLAQHVADTTHNGYLSSTDWNTFNTAGSSGITSLTGDVTATGPGAAAATLATVNSNVGSFTNANITVNAKGLITAASSGSTSGVTSITGTANQVIASSSTGAVTLSTPQSIGTSSSVTFNDVTVAGGSSGLKSTGGNLTLLAAGSVKLTSSGGGAVVIDTINVQPTTSASADLGLSSLPFGSAFLKGSLHFQQTGAGTNDITLAAPASVTSYALTWPSAQSSGTQFLQNNGSGALSWASGGSGTVNTGTTGQVAYYASSTNAVSGSSYLTTDNSTEVTIGTGGTGSTAVQLNLNSGNSSGTIVPKISLQRNSVAVGTIEGNASGPLINAIPGSSVFLGVNSAVVATVNSTNMTMAQPIAMGSNKITGLANGTASTDAAAFGQLLGVRILQIVSNSTSTTTTSSSATYADATSLSVTITPTLATSTIWIISSVACLANNSAAQICVVGLRIVRGTSTVVNTYNSATGMGSGTSTAERCSNQVLLFSPDSPATTSATTYKIQMNSGNSTATASVNDQVITSTASFIYAVEVG